MVKHRLTTDDMPSSLISTNNILIPHSHPFSPLLILDTQPKTVAKSKSIAYAPRGRRVKFPTTDDMDKARELSKDHMYIGKHLKGRTVLYPYCPTSYNYTLS